MLRLVSQGPAGGGRVICRGKRVSSPTLAPPRVRVRADRPGPTHSWLDRRKGQRPPVLLECPHEGGRQGKERRRGAGHGEGVLEGLGVEALALASSLAIT